MTLYTTISKVNLIDLSNGSMPHHTYWMVAATLTIQGVIQALINCLINSTAHSYASILMIHMVFFRVKDSIIINKTGPLDIKIVRFLILNLTAGLMKSIVFLFLGVRLTTSKPVVKYLI